MRRKIHFSQKPLTALEPAIKKFHSSLLWLRNTGNFKACDFVSMDQTLFPFVRDNGKTYDKKDVKQVWAQSGQSGLDKRQATVQLTVFTDEVDRVRPIFIQQPLQGKGCWISAKEKQRYDRQVKVMYQDKAWCDQEIMKEWISTEWTNLF